METIYIVIDIVVFLLTIFVILFYRQLDRKDRQIHLVKALMENMQYELDEKFRKMRSTVEAMEDSIQGHEITVESLLKKIDGSLGDLDRHAEDLNKLQSYMSHYHRILNELDELTAKAEKRVKNLEPELKELETAGVKVDAWIGEAEQIRRMLSDTRESIEMETDAELQRRVAALRSQSEGIAEELESRYRDMADELLKSLEKRVLQLQPAERAAEQGEEVAEDAIDEPETSGNDGPESLAPIEELLEQPEISPLPEESKSAPEEKAGYPEDDEPFQTEMFAVEEQSAPDQDDDEPDDDEEIYLQDDEEDSIVDEEELAEIEEKLTKRDIVAKYAKEGADSASIAEKTGIPRGEVELILELMDFTQ